MYNICEICLDSIGRTIPHNCQEHDEFQNIENVMMKIFNILGEDDKQGLVESQKDLSVLTGKLKGISV